MGIIKINFNLVIFQFLFSSTVVILTATVKFTSITMLCIDYEPDEWSSENGNFIDCTKGRTDPDPEKVCEFKLDWLAPCMKEDGYGWGDGQPCIILKLNKVLL